MGWLWKSELAGFPTIRQIQRTLYQEEPHPLGYEVQFDSLVLHELSLSDKEDPLNNRLNRQEFKGFLFYLATGTEKWSATGYY